LNLIKGERGQKKRILKKISMRRSNREKRFKDRLRVVSAGISVRNKV
jgi:hypothetical protein